MPTSFIVTNETDLNSAIQQIDLTGSSSAPNTNYTITFGAGLTGANALQLTTDLDAINLAGGDTLTIDGGGAEMTGLGDQRGFFVYSGDVTINDLTIENAVATGGAGGPGAGGGAGLGGGLFVASAGVVTLNDVAFQNDAAVGGSGTNGDEGGGGGLGGAGGAFGGGGGGIGTGATGGSEGAGGAGILLGASSGGAGPEGEEPGGLDGGGGGEGGGGGGIGGGVGTFEAAGAGGFGGGGGSGDIEFTGAAGGFGGGGGAERSGLSNQASPGGFGGGGGSGDVVVGGAGGFGGGQGGNATTGLGDDRGGGGGLGAGGAVFVQQGGQVTIGAGSETGGSVTGGAAGSVGASTAGLALGSGIFIQGNQTVTLAPGVDQDLTIDDVIADQTGSGGTDANAGAGSLLVGTANVASTVTLSATNTFTGGINLTGGTLVLAASGAAGSGAITFGIAGGQLLQIDAAALTAGGVFANTIDGLAIGETIDLQGVGLETQATLGSDNTLTLSGSSGPITLQFDLGQSFTGQSFAVASDGAGGTDVTLFSSLPVIAGTVAGQAVNDDATDQPFAAVTISDPNPAPQAETITITLLQAGLATDAGGTLSGTGLTRTGVGTYTLSAATPAAAQDAVRALVFTPTAHEVAPGDTVTTQFVIGVTDTIGQSAADTSTTVITTAQHDQPVITGAIAGQTILDEATVTPFSGVAISDVDFGQTEAVTITLSSAANGSLSNLGSGSYDAGTGVYTVTGTDAQVTTAVDALVFTPTAHQITPGDSVTTTFTITTVDTAGDTASDSTSSVIATAVNDPPVIGGTTAGQTTTDETTITPFSGVTIVDVDAGQTETVTVTLSSAANGSLSSLGSGSYDAETGVYTVTGTDTEVTTAVDALVFTPAAHQVAPGDSVTTTFTINATHTSGDFASDSTSSVIATAVNDPPVIGGTTAGQTTTDETTITPFSGVTIGDVDIGQTETVTVTLSSAANGSLSNLGSGSYDAETGVYTVTGTDAQVTTAVDALVFTPTAHQVAPGDTVTTTLTIAVTDSAGANASDTTTSVVATAVNDPPILTGPPNNIGVPNQPDTTPFADLTVVDSDVGHIDTVIVTLSDAAGGTLSNLGGGSYDSETGVYTVIGSADAVTAALQGLIFTPAPPAEGDVRTTGFTVAVTGPGGSATNSGISVTSVEQVLGLAGTPVGDDAVSVSPDGSSFAPPSQGKTNEAVVSAPSDGAAYTLPDGYQAEFLGGSASATLTDMSGGNALLVGNSGNDTITSSAANDTILGGAGQDVLSASGMNDVIDAIGISTVNTSGTNATVFGGTMALTATDTGTGDVLGLSTGTSNVTLGGSGATLYANTGPATVTDSGTDDAIGGYTGAMSLTLNGTGTSVFGGSGTLSIDMTSLASGVAIGTGDAAAALTISGANASVYGGSGSLDVDVTGSNALVGTGDGAASISVNGSNTTVFGGAGALSLDVEAGGTGALIGLGSGQASVTLAGTGTRIFGGSGSFTVNDAGSADTIAAGTNTTAITESGNDGVVVGSSGNLSVTGGAGAATIFGGTGHTTMSGGMGATALFGSAGGDLTFSGTAGGATYQAGLGNETLDASLSATANIINGGIDTTGRNSLVGGSGNDSMFAGTGADTFTGGAGNNEFVFYKGVVAGTAPTDVITDFNGNDIVILAGYGTTEAVNALSGAVSGGGSTTIRLSDNTQITFRNISGVSALSGHVLST